METETTEQPEVKTAADGDAVVDVKAKIVTNSTNAAAATEKRKKAGKDEEDATATEKTTTTTTTVKQQVEENGKMTNGSDAKDLKKDPVKEESTSDPTSSTDSKDSNSIGGHNLRGSKSHHIVSSCVSCSMCIRITY